MAWFDGTFTYDKEKIEKEFPVYVTDDLRLSEDKTKLAVINNFPENGSLLDVSDPHSEICEVNGVVFYHLFFGQDAQKACDTVNNFIVAGNHNDPEGVTLFPPRP